jgi:hypothetical protein
MFEILEPAAHHRKKLAHSRAASQQAKCSTKTNPILPSGVPGFPG